MGPSPKGRRVPPPAATSAAPTAAAGARASASPPAAGRSQAAADEGSTIRTFFSSLGTADAADALEVVDSGVAGPGPRGESGGGDDRAEALALRRYARSLARAEGAFDRARHEAESLRVERDLLRERVTALAEQLEQAECSAHGAAAPSRESRSASPATGSGPERSPPGARDSGSEPEMPPGGQGEVVSVSRPPPPGSPPRRVLRALWEALPEGSGGEATDSASPAALVRAVRETTQSLHAARSEAAAAERARADAETRAQEAEAASRREQAEYAAAAVRSLESQAHASQQCRVSEQEAERLRGDVARLEKQLAEARAEASEEARRLRREREEAESRLGEVLQARQTEAEEAEEVVARLRARLGEQARDRERSREEGSGGTAPSSQGSGEGEAQLRRAHATVDSLRRRVSELETAGERASAAMVESRRRALQAENEAEAAVAREREQQKALERAAVAQREAVRDAEAARARVAELERAVAAAEERAASESTRAEESARAASRAAGADAKLRSTASALAAETARRETAEARAAAVEGALARGQRAGWGTLRACARYHAIVQAYSSLRVAALSRRAAMRALAPQNPASATADASELAGDETERVATFHRAQPRSDLLRRFAEKQTISILRQAPAWARLDDMLLRRFVAACDTVTFGSGEIIIKKGERGQRLYYILEVRATQVGTRADRCPVVFALTLRAGGGRDHGSRPKGRRPGKAAGQALHESGCGRVRHALRLAPHRQRVGHEADKGERGPRCLSVHSSAACMFTQPPPPLPVPPAARPYPDWL